MPRCAYPGSRAGRHPESGEDAVAGLSGTGRLADDLYLVAHHEQTGKPHLQPRALGLGLAGGLLAELMLSRSIRLWRGRVMAADASPPGDGLARSVLGQVAGEREHLPPRDWLLYLARTATVDVAGRLEQAGYLTRATTWRFGRGVRWVPVDADSAFAPLVRVKSALGGPPGRWPPRTRPWAGSPPPAAWDTRWPCTCRRTPAAASNKRHASSIPPCGS